MGRKDQRCSVCSAAPDVRAAIDAALANRTKLRDLAASSGFSRSSLSRHSQRCTARETLLRHRTQKIASLKGRRILYALPAADWNAAIEPKPTDREHIFAVTDFNPAGRPTVYQPPIQIHPEALRPSDVILTVQFDPPVPSRAQQRQALFDRAPE